MSQKLYFAFEEGALGRFQFEARLAVTVEYKPEVREVLMERTREDINIIEVHQDTEHFEIVRDIVHGPLKGNRHVTEALRHPSRLKKALTGDEGTFLLVLERKVNLLTATHEVHCREVL